MVEYERQRHMLGIWDMIFCHLLPEYNGLDKTQGWLTAYKTLIKNQYYFKLGWEGQRRSDYKLIVKEKARSVQKLRQKKVKKNW